jgi:hypothetical protein
MSPPDDAIVDADGRHTDVLRLQSVVGIIVHRDAVVTLGDAAGPRLPREAAVDAERERVPGVVAVILFPPSLTARTNKLERLSPTSFLSLV